MTAPPLDLPAERLTELRDIANAATDGPWVSIPGAWGGDGYIDRAAQINGEPEIAVCDYDADRDHIAAFDPPTVLALLDRVEEAHGLLARLSASGGRNIDLIARAEAAERDLAAVTVSRDGWQTRAEAAEAAIQRVRDLASDSAFNAQDIYGDLPATEYDDQDHAVSLLAVTVRALNHAMDGGA